MWWGPKGSSRTLWNSKGDLYLLILLSVSLMWGNFSLKVSFMSFFRSDGFTYSTTVVWRDEKQRQHFSRGVARVSMNYSSNRVLQFCFFVGKDCFTHTLVLEVTVLWWDLLQWNHVTFKTECSRTSHRWSASHGLQKTNMYCLIDTAIDWLLTHSSNQAPQPWGNQLAQLYCVGLSAHSWLKYQNKKFQHVQYK